MDTPWHIELFGWLRATQGDRIVTRFRAQKGGALLAYLAYHLQRPHPREVLIELLWPEAEPRSGRNSLRRELSSLRRQLEPPGVPAGAVILADRANVQLNPAACTTDVAEFESALTDAARAASASDRAQRLSAAVELYSGELLPGYFPEWIVPERQRLAEAFLQALGRLTTHSEEEGDHETAIAWARRAVAADPLREELHCRLIGLLAAAGQPDAALRQYQELERLFAREFGVPPAPETRQLLQEVERCRDQVHDGSTRAQNTGSASLLPAAVQQPPGAQVPVISSDAPTGTVTFLLIEIDPQEPQTDHLGPLLRLLVARGGSEISSAGRSLQFAFARASDALAAGVAAQGAGAESLSRMAMHTSEVPSDKLTPQSPALQHALRLLRSAHPGQILLSEKSAVLLRDDLEHGLQLLDLGPYRLRDDAPPERLFQVCSPDLLAQEFPPPNARPAHEGNLPLQFTRFFGRDEEIARLRGLLGPSNSGSDSDQPAIQNPKSKIQNRLITLTGPGGSGKTRLAIEVAGRLRPAFHGAVWFVPLQDLTDARLIPDKLLDALRLPRSPQIPPMDQAVSFLSRQPSLLLLDNFEHLVTEGADWVQSLLEQAPALTCLLTSRQRLNLPAEHEFPVAALPVPVEGPQWTANAPSKTDPSDPSDPSDLFTLTQYPSVALFVDRAQAVRPDFQITRTNAAAVAGLCERLEGLPLALVLAAARSGVLTPSQMLERLTQRDGAPWTMLVSTERGAAPRHRSLWAALEWSYQLLSPELQRFFTHLSVFRGGWTLAAAEAVCEEPAALEYLEQLRGCSLVVAEEAGVQYSPLGAGSPELRTPNAEHRTPQMRFRLLETLREFGAEQLVPIERTDVARRHLQYYLALAERAEAEAGSPERAPWLDRLEEEHDNMRTALTWSLESDVETGLRLATALNGFWMSRDHYREAQVWLGRALERGQCAAPALRAPALVSLAQASYWLGDYVSMAAQAREGLALARQMGDLGCISTSLMQLGTVADYQGQSERAVSLLDESVAVARQLGDNSSLAIALHCRGVAAYTRRDYEAATAFQEESLACYRQARDKRMLIYPLAWLGKLALNQGQLQRAKSLWEEAMALAREAGYQRGVAGCLECLARLRKAEGQVRRAVRLMAAADRLRAAISTPAEPLTVQAEYKLDVAEASAQLGEEAFAAAWAEGRVLTWQQAAAEALQEVPAG